MTLGVGSERSTCTSSKRLEGTVGVREMMNFSLGNPAQCVPVNSVAVSKVGVAEDGVR